MTTASRTTVIASPQTHRFTQPLPLQSGAQAAQLRAGVRNLRTAQCAAQQCRAGLLRLNASHHVAGVYADAQGQPIARSEGWWDNMIGPGKPLDTNRFS